MRLFTLGFVAGALVLQQQAELPELRWALLAPALLLARALPLGAARPVAWTLLLFAGLAAGFGTAAWRAQLRMADELPRGSEGRDLEVMGIVADLPRWHDRGVRFLLAVDSGDAVPALVSLTWYAEDRADLPRIEAGQRWRLTVRLRRPRGLANPHAFDFEPWALERGIRATGYVRPKGVAERLEARVDGWPYTLHRWRGEIRDSMQASLGEARLAGVLVALAIGDQDAIPAPDWEVYWRTGVGHLMSISGLHITMLAALAYALVAFVWVRMPALALRLPARKAGVVAGALTALAYSLVAGFAVPAQRTFVMLAVAAACLLAERHGSASRVLALAALAVVAADPWAVLSPGFWLSFGALAAIFYAAALRTGSPGRWRAAALEQLVVTLAMMPMLLALFQELSLVSPLANAFAIPVVSLLVVPLTLAGAFLDAPLLLQAAHAAMSLVMAALEALAAWPAAMLEVHAPSAAAVGAALLGCAWLLAPRGVPMRSWGALWMASLVVVPAPRPIHGEAWIDVLDVGQGLAVVVRTASRSLAYDTGPSWSADSDSGGRIVVPYLRGEGIARLDALVVTHADDDHAGGAVSIAARRSPSWLLSSLPRESALHAAVVRSTPCIAGQDWEWDGVRFSVLHPLPGAREPTSGKPPKENDLSCVLRVATAGGSMLLTGDIEARGEAQLIARAGGRLQADALLVPHHGSRTSSTPAFLDAVAPRVALLPVGYRNRFRHPHEAVMARYVARGIAVRRTDLEGALRVRLPGGIGEVTVESLAPPPRYWSDRKP